MLSPFRSRRGFYDPVSEMNRVFDNMLGGLLRRSGGQQRAEVTAWAPTIDVVTENGDLVIKAELPGVKQEASGQRADRLRPAQGRAGRGARWLLRQGAPVRLV